MRVARAECLEKEAKSGFFFQKAINRKISRKNSKVLVCTVTYICHIP